MLNKHAYIYFGYPEPVISQATITRHSTGGHRYSERRLFNGGQGGSVAHRFPSPHNPAGRDCGEMKCPT